MEIQVHLNSALRKYVEGSHLNMLSLDLPEGTTAAGLIHTLSISPAEVETVIVNGTVAGFDHVLNKTDRVGLFPQTDNGHVGKQESLRQLRSGQMPERYLRNKGTIGLDGQLKLLNSKVIVIGSGGLGGAIVELLARLGVGYLKVVDGDVFAAHNLNRQLLSTERNLGQNKAIAASSRIADVNSDVCVEPFPFMLDEDNVVELLTGMDVVVDALDNIPIRLLLSKTAQHLEIPFVHGAIAGFTGQITTVMPGDRYFEKIYRTQDGADRGIETTLGNPAATPALAAALQVQEVVKIITGTGKPLNKKLLYFDTGINSFKTLAIN